MKKQYTTPQVKTVKFNPANIICTSASFGDGETNVMHAKRCGSLIDFDEEDDDLGFE